MKKRLAVIAGAVMVMGLALAGCSPEAANSAAKEPAAATAAEKKEETSSSQNQSTEAKESQAAEAGAEIKWPEENITLHVPGSAGGATDLSLIHI